MPLENLWSVGIAKGIALGSRSPKWGGRGAWRGGVERASPDRPVTAPFCLNLSFGSVHGPRMMLARRGSAGTLETLQTMRPFKQRPGDLQAKTGADHETTKEVEGALIR